MSLLQGLFPATSSYNVTLANGTNVEGPLGGYQVCKCDFITSRMNDHHSLHTVHTKSVVRIHSIRVLTIYLVESVEPDNDVSLEGYTSCGVSYISQRIIVCPSQPTQAFDTSTNAFYNSTEFQAKANESASFINQLAPYLDGRPVTLKNMVMPVITSCYLRL